MPDNKICKFRVGQGYDVHRLVTDRRLILGGVDIPYEKGLLGHSDADVLAHAITDALLGAAALGDIGKLFPDNDPEYEGADSLMLTRRVARVLEENGYAISNVDATIIAQSPKLAPYIDKMRENIAAASSLPGIYAFAPCRAAIRLFVPNLSVILPALYPLFSAYKRRRKNLCENCGYPPFLCARCL